MRIIHCYECDEEFDVVSIYDTDAEVSFCPYCGSEIELEEDEDEDLDPDEHYESFRN